MPQVPVPMTTEKVFDTQSKSIGYLVESRKRWICPMVYELAYLLFRYA